jgi:molecular chaperone GrpE
MMGKKPRTVEIKIDPEEGEPTPVEERSEAPAPADATGAESAAAATEAPPRPISYEEVFDRLQRLQAEFDNYRRRTDRERLETGAHAQGLLAERLLPVLDAFDRALASQRGDESPEVQGFALIREKLYRALVDAGLERIDSEGTTFDPDIHEALMTQDVEPELDGVVICELAPGYRFRGRMVRPARVQVGKAAES